jgi:hypothetical protein
MNAPLLPKFILQATSCLQDCEVFLGISGILVVLAVLLLLSLCWNIQQCYARRRGRAICRGRGSGCCCGGGEEVNDEEERLVGGAGSGYGVVDRDG